MKKISVFLLAIFWSFNANSAEVEKYEIIAKKIDSARNKLSTKTGTSSYSFSNQNIENLPQGQITSLNQLLLRAPGVSQNAGGQVHIRLDHSNLQYRINGVIIPETIGSFGQMMDVHFIESVDLLTGALPAEYGNQTAGVVEIKTKSGFYKKEARSEITVGSNNHVGLNQNISGSKGNLSYYLNVYFLENSRGIEAPTKDKKTYHNDTRQDKLFSYFSYILDEQTKLNVMVGHAKNKFQIPNNPNQQTAYNLNGYNAISSLNLNENQQEQTSYGIMSLQGVILDKIDYQFSIYDRYSKVNYRGDMIGNLMFDGVASNIDKISNSVGLQADFSYQINSKNTLRSGFIASNERVKNYSNNLVFSGEPDNQTSDIPFNIEESAAKNIQNYGLYLQNEYKPISSLTLNYGARFDAVNSYLQEQYLSPRFGGVYKFSSKTNLHFGYAKYFTAPKNQSLSQYYLSRFDGTTNQAPGQNSDFVKSQKTNYYDVGITHKLNSNINLGLDTYYKDVKNMLDEEQFGQALIYTAFNYEKSRAYGAEFTLDYQKDNFSSYFNFAWQKVEANNIVSSQALIGSEELDYIKRNYIFLDHDQRISASSGFSYLYKTIRYNFDVIYGSGLRKEEFTKHLPSYFQANLGIAKDFYLPQIQKFNLRFMIVNLFDRSYKLQDGAGIGVAAAKYAPRRSFFLTFSKNF